LALRVETKAFTRRLSAAFLFWAMSGFLAFAQDRPLIDDQIVGTRCKAPQSTIATDAPLPNVAKAFRKGDVVKVLAIGSSSTVGVGASSPSRAYPAQLEEILEKHVSGLDVFIISRGISGELAAATAERIRTEVALRKPDLLIWQVGTNDALSRVSLDEFNQTVLNTVRWLKSNDIDVVLVGLQYTKRIALDQHCTGVKNALRQIAEQENVVHVTRYDAMQFIANALRDQSMLAPDDFHLNDLGYRCMAEHVASGIVASLKPKR
jgi:acyl-CoA thioesterase I